MSAADRVFAPERGARSIRGSGQAPVEGAPKLREIDLLGPAHQALREGNATRALELATRHAEVYATGAMREEREAFAIEALHVLGRDEAWASCEATCIEICSQVAAGIACGAPGCGAGEVCCIPTGSTDTRSCSAASCAQNNYTRACDGPEDCMPGGTCCGGDNLWTATCVPPGSSCGPLEQYCHVGTDCDASEPFCCPGPVEDMRSCSATDAPSCT